MRGQSKTYVIDPVTEKDSETISSSSKDGFKELAGHLQSSGKTGLKGKGELHSQQSEKQSGGLLALSYLAGPLSIFATRRGRRNKFWAGLSVFSVILSIVVIWMWGSLSSWSSHENPVGTVMLIGAVVAVLSGVSTWTRTIVLAGRFEGPRLRRVPDWFKRSLTLGLFGMICPGMGLYVAGRSKQAAGALWMASMTAISFILLSRVFWVWTFNSYAGAFSIKPDTLEYVFIGISALAVLGCIAWIVQALNGARVAARASSRKSGSNREWVSVSLLISLIAFSIFSRPEMVAEVLDTGAVVSSSEGMKIIPIYLVRAAIYFDSSKPDYTVRAIELYEDHGDQFTADRMRRGLIELLKSSVPLLEEEGIVISKSGSYYEALTGSASNDVRSDDSSNITIIPAELLVLEWEIAPAIP